MRAPEAERHKQTSRKERKAELRKVFGKRLVGLRLAAGYRTQAALAEHIPGISREVVSNWEIGYSVPDIFVIPNLCRALKCTYAEFFGESIFYSVEHVKIIAKLSKMSESQLSECLKFLDYVASRE